ncbi:MAG: PAS domain-containing protein [Rhodobacteraceae bacterium]|nr:PAS domain-containing protein [Paracoccaceae bacterium]
MSDTARLSSRQGRREIKPDNSPTVESQARTLTRAMDLLNSCEDLEEGVRRVLCLCRAATQADLWMLLRRAGGSAVTLAAGPQDVGQPDWADAEEFLARPRRVTYAPDSAGFDHLPDALQPFRSMISAPLELADTTPMAIMLLSRRQDAFTQCDHDLLQGIARLVMDATRARHLEHQNAMLAKVLDRAPARQPEPVGVAETSFQALNRVYARLGEWQGAIVEITNDLLSADARESEAAINRALASTGMLARSDRTYVFRSREPDRIDNTHEWTAPDIEPMIAHLQDMPASLMDEWRPDMAVGRAVHIPDVEALPESSAVRDVLMMQGIRSLLAVPMLRDGRIAGFVGFDAVRAYRQFLPLEIQLLQAVANSINVVLDRCAAETAAETARAHLEAERNRLQATLTAIPDLVLELDREGRFTSHVAGGRLSPAVRREDFLGRTPEEVLPPHLARLARRVMRIVDRDGQVSGLEYEFPIDDVPRWYSLSAAAKSEQGDPGGYVFVIRDITSQFAQRRRVQRLGKIAELTSNLVVVTDAEQQIEWVNPAFERRTGWRLEEVIGKRPDSFLASENTDRAEMRRIGAALRDSKPVRAELLNQTREGEEYWISKDIQPLFAPDGQVEGFVAVQTDITDIKLSHQQVLHDRAVALDASGDGIAITDASGYYIYMNAAHRRMFGIGEEEDISRLNWQDLVPADTVATFLAEHWNSFEKTGIWRGEIDGLHRDGSLVPQEVSLTLRDNGMLCIARDISERRQMERALHDRAVALDASDDGIAITDATGHYVYMNAAHRRMFGITDAEDIRALHWHRLYPEATVQRFMARDWPTLQAEGRWRGELHGVHRDGSPVPQEVSLSLHDDGILCLTRDISDELQQAAERAALREELQLAQRRETIAHLASGVAHDLNNLVAVVSGSISLLRTKVADDKDATASVERIRRAAETARDLVSGLGHLGRPEAQRSTHDLRDLITEGVELLGTRRLREHELSTALPDTPRPVWANGTELLQVIVNLALNACEARADLPNRVSLAICEDGALPDRAPDAGALRRDAEHSVFTIHDSGTGIDAELRERLFERYFTTKSDTGTGLGLPIVAGILRDNAAALWIDSTPGQGTTVTVAWPAHEPRRSATRADARAHGSGASDLRDRNILVVDDLPDVADVLSEFLEASNANAVAVADPAEAATLLRDNPGTWAALVTDLDMPAMSGRALARVAAACEPAVPVVLVTALPEAVGPDTGLFCEVLPKPVQPERLVAGVHAAIQQAEAPDGGQTADKRES